MTVPARNGGGKKTRNKTQNGKKDKAKKLTPRDLLLLNMVCQDVKKDEIEAKTWNFGKKEDVSGIIKAALKKAERNSTDFG